MKSLPALLLALAAAAPLPAAHQRIYMLGNSLTDDVHYEGFSAIVAEAGHTLALGSFRIPGAPINWLWNNPVGGYVHAPYNRYPEAFANHTWDAVTLQPFSTYANELQHARYFAQSLRGQGTFGPGAPQAGTPTGISPGATVYIYAQWPGSMPDTWHSSIWLAQSTAGTGRGAHYYETFVNELAAAEPATSVRLLPVGHVFHELHQLSRAGRIPGITRQGDFMADSIHLNNRGSYIPALTFYSVIYGADPRGLACPSQFPLTAEQAAIVQNAVWKVVSRHPQTGLADGLTVTTPSLPDCVEGQPYSATLAAAQADGAVTWSLAPGSTLPDGLALSSSGVLSGIADAPGTFDFVARATDAGGAVAERDFILFVLSDNPPVVATAGLPAAPYGAPYEVRLAHNGGIGDVSWSIAKNDLPHGLVLDPDGRLHGTPLSVQATFTPTFRVEDSLGSSAQLALPLAVGAPEPATLISGPTTSAPTIDGDLAEPLWSFPHAANRRLYGAVNNTAVFGLRWDASALYLGVRVEDSVVRPAEDAVHLFLDALHDREGVYNADDRHFVVRADGSLTEHNGRSAGVAASVRIRAGGYDVEVRVPFSHLDLAPGDQSLSLGFDLGVSDSDAAGAPPAYQVWLATDRAAPAPSLMGNLVLAVGPLARNLVVDPSFDGTLTRLAYPSRTTAAQAGIGWVANGVSSRPFATIDNLGYGFPAKAIIASGADRISTMRQVILDQRTATGAGVLRFDVKLADPDIAYRLFAYNGTASEVTALMGTESQQHPARGGTPAATLLAGTLGDIPSSTTWREVALPVDFGPGYDYYVLAFSSPGGDTVPLDSRVDNIHLGPLAAQRSIAVASEPPALSIESLRSAGSEGEGGDALAFRVSRPAAAPQALAFSLDAGGSATADEDYAWPDALYIPGRAASTEFSLAPFHDRLAEGAETLTLALSPSPAYTLGSPSAATGTIADHPRDAWYFQNLAAGATDWLADPDGDGVANLLEYALATDPRSASPAPAVELVGDALTLAYLRARDDLVYRVETSTDLADWTAAGVAQDPAAGLDELAVASVPLDPATPRRFLRLRVEERN